MPDRIRGSFFKRAGHAGWRLATEVAVSSAATLCVTLAFSGWIRFESSHPLQQASNGPGAVVAASAQAMPIFYEMPSPAEFNQLNMPI
jgi:hypothetical protein